MKNASLAARVAMHVLVIARTVRPHPVEPHAQRAAPSVV
jgi:hypothetical protein